MSLRTLFAVCLALAALGACQKQQAPEAAPALPASAASAPPGASADSPEALMKEAFPQWGDPGGFSISVPADGGKGVLLVHPDPLLVLAPDSEHRLLVVTGVPVDEEAHATTGNLGLYGFTLSQGRWIRTSELPSFAWMGEYGRVGEVYPLALSPGRTTIAAKNRYCAQGHCQTTLEVFLLGERTVRLILSEQIGLGTNDDEQDACDELVQAAAAGASVPKNYEGLAMSYCPATTSDMAIRKGDNEGWPDIEFHFKGQDFGVDPTTQAVKHTVIDETLVLRFSGSRYLPASGRNPLTSRN